MTSCRSSSTRSSRRSRARGRVSKLVHEDMATQMTFGERRGDKVAQFGGSWGFIGLFGGVLVVWMLVNAWVLARHPFDPYPSFC